MTFREGPSFYAVPVCVKTPLGFIGGPSGYLIVRDGPIPSGPIIIDLAPGQGVAESEVPHGKTSA